MWPTATIREPLYGTEKKAAVFFIVCLKYLIFLNRPYAKGVIALQLSGCAHACGDPADGHRPDRGPQLTVGGPGLADRCHIHFERDRDLLAPAPGTRRAVRPNHRDLQPKRGLSRIAARAVMPAHSKPPLSSLTGLQGRVARSVGRCGQAGVRKLRRSAPASLP